MPKAYVGIDLGTTNTACAIAEVRDDGTMECRQIPLQQLDVDAKGAAYHHDKTLPSVVWLAEGNQVYTGTFCRDNADLISQHAGSKVIHGIKSELANRHWKLLHNGQKYGPAEISSCILRTAWATLLMHLQSHQLALEVIIITIPASFSSAMRRETLRAAEMAGLPMEKVSLLDEPIAAVFSSYESAAQPFPNIHTDEPIVVFDMGGGTVDVTALTIQPNERVVRIHSTSRYNQVAGDDLDLEIAAYLWRRLACDPAKLTRVSSIALLRAGEAVKRAVSERIGRPPSGDTQAVREECRKHNLAVGVKIDLSPDFEGVRELAVPVADILDILRPFLDKNERANNFGRNIFTPILEALDRGGLSPIQIKQVYLAGGGAYFNPVYLELGAFFNSALSPLAGPEYAVSHGAAKFAALSRSHAWHVSETTSERIYLRRIGQSFLEVLPDKLPIPSEPRAPARPLEGNDTIVLDEETLDVALEFYQGTRDNDPQMMPIYRDSLSFERPLPKGTFLRSLTGHIDRDKIYCFESVWQKPKREALKRRTAFSADSRTNTTTSAPSYQLNRRPLFEETLQRDPLKTLVNGRRTSERVMILGERTAAATEIPPQELKEARKAILKALNESWADTYVGDKFLPARIRETLPKLQDFQPRPGARDAELPKKLVELFEDYGTVIVRPLLDHSYLLYGTYNLRQKVAPLVKALTDKVRGEPELVAPLLADLDRHANSAYDVVRQLVQFFLETVEDIPQIRDTILAPEAPYGLALKILAAKKLCDPHNAAPRLLALLKQQLDLNLKGEDYERRVPPLIDALARTGEHGFHEARMAFERQELPGAGGRTLGSFGETFYHWAVHQHEIKPWYVPAVFEAVPHLDSRAHREELGRLLMDKWSNDPKVQAAIDAIPPEKWRPLIKLGIKPPNGVVRPTSDLKKEILDAATKGQAGRLRHLRRETDPLTLARAIADVLASSPDDRIADYLLEVFTTNAKPYFVRKLVGSVLWPGAFERMTDSRQMLVIRRPVTRSHAKREQLQRLQQKCTGEVLTEVMRLISEKMNPADE